MGCGPSRLDKLFATTTHYDNVQGAMCTTWYGPFKRQYKVERTKNRHAFNVYFEDDLTFRIKQKYLKLTLEYAKEKDDDAMRDSTDLEKAFMRLDGMEAALNSVVLEWAQGREVWVRDPDYYETEESENLRRLLNIKHEYEKWDYNFVGFVTIDQVDFKHEWRYRPGGKIMERKERKHAKRKIQELFDSLKEEFNTKYMSFESFQRFFEELMKDIAEMRGETARRLRSNTLKARKTTSRGRGGVRFTKNDKVRMVQIFKMFDKDRDGFLNFKEMTKFVHETNDIAKDDYQTWGKISYTRLCRKLDCDGTFGLTKDHLVKLYEMEANGVEELRLDIDKLFHATDKYEKYNPPHSYQVDVKFLDVRKCYDENSEPIKMLDKGTLIRVDEKREMSVHITVPIQGWVFHTANGPNNSVVQQIRKMH